MMNTVPLVFVTLVTMTCFLPSKGSETVYTWIFSKGCVNVVTSLENYTVDDNRPGACARTCGLTNDTQVNMALRGTECACEVTWTMTPQGTRTACSGDGGAACGCWNPLHGNYTWSLYTTGDNGVPLSLGLGETNRSGCVSVQLEAGAPEVFTLDDCELATRGTLCISLTSKECFAKRDLTTWANQRCQSLVDAPFTDFAELYRCQEDNVFGVFWTGLFRVELPEPEYISSQSSPSTTLQEHQGPRSLSPVSTMQPSTADAISPTRTTDIVTSHVTPSELQVNVLSSSIVQSTNSFPETAFIHFTTSSIDSVPTTSVHSELPALNQSTASSSYPGATITDLSHVRMATMTTSDLTMPLSSSASIHPTTSQPPATTSSSPSSTNRESPTTSATSASQWSSTDVTSRTPTNAVAQGTQVTPPSIQPSPDASKPTLEVPAPPTQPQPESSTPSKNDSTLEFVEVEGVSEAQVANNSTGQSHVLLIVIATCSGLLLLVVLVATVFVVRELSAIRVALTVGARHAPYREPLYHLGNEAVYVPDDGDAGPRPHGAYGYSAPWPSFARARRYLPRPYIRQRPDMYSD